MGSRKMIPKIKTLKQKSHTKIKPFAEMDFAHKTQIWIIFQPMSHSPIFSSINAKVI